MCTFTFYIKIIDGDDMNCGPGRTKSIGWTVPNGDIVLQVGTPLEIFCILNLNETQSANNIVFYRNNDLIDQRYVTVINSTTSRLYIENITESNDWFYCKLRQIDTSTKEYEPSSLETSNQIDSNDVTVCMNTVAVGSPPKEVENFTCISKNWELLNCSWSVPENFVPTNYSVSYQFLVRSGRNKKFPCSNDTDVKLHYCVWTMKSSVPYRRNFEYLRMIVEGVNQFNKSEQKFWFHHYAYIIPDAPVLEMVNKTSSSIYLKWNIEPFDTYDNGLKYNIQYTWLKNLNWVESIYDSRNLTSQKGFVYLNVTGLPYGNMLYDFRVYMKTAAAFNNTGWSAPGHNIFRTVSCPPYKSPKTDVGSFEIALNSATSRTVYLYFEPLQSLEYNGDDFNYMFVALEGDNENNQREVNLTALSTASSYAEFNISSNSYHFYLKSINKEGAAPNASIIRVPRYDNVVKHCSTFTKMDYGNGDYELSWEPPMDLNIDRIVSYTIFSCESHNERPYQCGGYLKWKHFPPYVTKYNYTVDNKSTGYQFAISVNTLNSSSGMLWASCTVWYGKVGVVSSIRLESTDSFSINIEWKLECTDKGSIVEGYRIFYCVISTMNSTECEEAEQHVDLFGGIHKTSAQINNLKPYTHYKMSVMILTKNNRTGRRSSDVTTRTKDGPADVSNVEIKVTNVTNISAVVSWNKPRKMNGMLQYYLIDYNGEIMNVSVSTTKAFLSSLHSYHLYQVAIRACSLVCSASSNVTTFRTKIGVPGIVINPEARVEDSQAKITWKAPSVLSGPNPIYEVVFQKGGIDMPPIETKDTSAIMPMPECEVEKPKSLYVFKIRAKNVNNYTVHAGDWSPALTLSCSTVESLVWKVLACIFIPLALAVVFVYCGKSGRYKCNRMKSVPVALPTKFTITSTFPNDCKELNDRNDRDRRSDRRKDRKDRKERKNSEAFESFCLPQVKSSDEFCTLVEKTTELVQ
ncbi:hypothetical protein PGB90_001387 [Kerria lacca]